jgi:N-glycosylase/DNA lyase
MKYQDCRLELLKLPGVGPKVADCISLFSCCKHGVIPVDTHVLQIATRDYDVSVKNLNAKTYLLIGDAFRDAFGEFAGWAHSVLFSADLKPASNSTAAPKTKGSKKRKAVVLEE